MPRFELSFAAGGAQALVGRPLAIAPLPGGEQRVGEVSGAAEALGVRRGMALGEALARSPGLTLVPADPVGVQEAWEGTIGSLESIGAAVETARPGLAYFETVPLRALHGGDAAVIATARQALQGNEGARPARPGRLRRSSGARHMRIGGGPTRFCSLVSVAG